MHDYWEPAGPKLDLNAPIAQTKSLVSKIVGHCTDIKLSILNPGYVPLPVLYSNLLKMKLDDKIVEVYNMDKHAGVNIFKGDHHIQACRVEPIKYQFSIFSAVLVFVFLCLCIVKTRFKAK